MCRFIAVIRIGREFEERYVWAPEFKEAEDMARHIAAYEHAKFVCLMEEGKVR